MKTKPLRRLIVPVKSKKSKAPKLPDLKVCAQSALRCALEQLEAFTIIDLYGVHATDCSYAAYKIYEDAKALAVNYIKKGIEL